METPSPREHQAEGSQADAAAVQFLRFRRHRDRAALEQSLMLCAPVLRREARRFAGAADVDDLVHDCFVVAIRRVESFDDQACLLPWLLGILHNLARSRHRRRWRFLHKGVTPNTTLVSAPNEEAPAVVDRAEWLHTVSAHVQALPEPYCTVVTSHLLGDESLAEIAARLGRSANTVRTQFARGLQQLRRRLPAPMLAGLTAVLTTRSASARGAAPPLRRATGRIVAAGLIVAALSLVWSVLSAPPRFATAAVGAGTPQSQRSAAVASTGEPPAGTERVLAGVDFASTVSVRVQYAGGAPAAGIPVILVPRFVPGLTVPRCRPSWRFATTDAAGEARFAVDMRGHAAIRLHDMAVLHRFEVTDAPCNLAFTIEPAPELEVVLIDEQDLPIPGGTIFASGTTGTRAPGYPAGTTDGEGRVRIRCVLPRFWIWATADGYSNTCVYIVESHAAFTRGTVTTLVLRRSARRCRGTVEAADGGPLANATVMLWSNADRRPAPIHATTDSRGRFDVGGLVEGPWSVSAVAPGFACRTIDGLAPDAEALVRLARGADVTGRVDEALCQRRSTLRVITRSLGDDYMSPIGTVGSAISDEGTYRLSNLAEGQHDVGLFDQSSEPIVTRRVNVVEGIDQQVDLTTDEEVPWAIRVVDDHGRALSGVLVRTQSPLELVGHEYELSSRTDATGVARIATTDKAPVRLFVHLARGSEPDLLPAVEVDALVAGQPATVTVPAAALCPCGLRVRLPANAEASDSTQLCLHRGGSTLALARRADGQFAADDLPPGRYQLRLKYKDAPNPYHIVIEEVELRASETMDLGTLPDMAFGDVVLEVAARDASAAVITYLRDDLGNLLEVAHMAPGKPHQRRLPAGRYTIEYGDSDAAARKRMFEVVANAESRFELPRTAGVSCRVELLADSRRNQRQLYATLRGERDESGCVLLLLAGADHRHWWADLDLQPGVYRLTARSGHGEVTNDTFVVSARPGPQTFPFHLR